MIFATVRKSLFQPRGDEWATRKSIKLYLLRSTCWASISWDGDLFGGEIAEIKGDMIIKLVHPPGEELKFVVELPGEKQMIFSVDRHQIVSLAERWR